MPEHGVAISVMTQNAQATPAQAPPDSSRPVPTFVNVVGVTTPDGPMVVVSFTTPVGSSHYWLDPGAAGVIGDALHQAAADAAGAPRLARPTLTLPGAGRPGAIMGPSAPFPGPHGR